jgi:RHS repeat-associated protein
VLERNDYYPFGLRHANASHPISSANRLKFNGKEEQLIGNSGLLDYGARMYDNVLGRWLSVDPLAEKYYPISPYVYAGNNPVLYVDPDGRQYGYPLNHPALTASPEVKQEAWRMVNEGLSWTDFNDVYTVSSAASSLIDGREVSQIDGTSASWFDVGISAAGLFLPYVSGSAVKKAVENIGEGAKAVENVGDATQGAQRVEDAADVGTSTVYRVYGGDAKAAGFSWTPVDPGNVSNFRQSAGLPSGGKSGAMNTGQYVIEGTVENSDIMIRRPAEALDGNMGGLPEYLIDPEKVNINRVSGANPAF